MRTSTRILALSSLAALSVALGSCKTAGGDASATKNVAGDLAQGAKKKICMGAEAVVEGLFDKAGASVVPLLFKLGVPQGTDAKNVCSCIFVAGLTPAVCLEKETKINVKPGKASPLIVDTRYFVDVKVGTDAQGRPVVTATPKFECADLGGPTRIARYDGKDYGCTLTGDVVKEDAMQ